MRLNALYPEDNPMETLLFCFGGDGGGGGGGGDDDRPTTSPAQRGGLSSSAGRDTSRDAERDRDIGSIGGGRDDSDDDDRDDDRDQMDRDLDAISAEFDAMDAAYDAGESFTSEGVETGGGNNDMGPGGGGYLSGDIEDEQMAELDAITQQFEDMNRAIEETGGAAIGGDGSVSGRGTEGYEAVADTYEGMTGDDSITAGYPTETLQAGLVPDITVTVPQTPDELDAQLDAITQQFEEMSDLIDEGQGVAVTGSGDVLGLDSYDRAREEAVTNAVNAYKNNPDIQNSTTLNPEDPANIANLESKLADMSLDQIDTFARDLGGLEEGERSYGLPYSFEPPEVEVTLLPGDYEPTGFEDTFVSQDRIGAGVPVSTLPEGSYQIDTATNTVSLNEAGKAYMDELAKGYRNEPNEFGIYRQEIDSLMQQGQVVGAPMVQISTEDVGVDGSIEGAEARTGEGEDEAGLPGGSGGAGRLGDDEVAQEGVEDFAYDYPAFFPSETGDQAQQEQSTSGIGLSPDSGGVGLLPGEGGIIGTDSGIVGQSGSGGLNPFTEGGEGGEGDETSGILGQGEGQAGTGEGAGDGTGTGTPPDLVSGEGGDDGFEPAPPVQTDPYDFGSGEYDPLLDFEYRQPQITSPFDFARDFGSYTLSPEIEQSFQDLTADRLAQGFEPAALYEPEFLEQIGIMSPERQAEEGIASLIGSRFPQFTPAGERYPFDSTPEESAQSIVDSLLAGE